MPADPFGQGLAATANAALTSQTTVCWTTMADWRGNQARETRYLFSINRPDRYLGTSRKRVALQIL